MSDNTSIDTLVAAAQHVLVMQADNPDADSLGSALALESILGALGKEVSLYCAVDMPTYLQYMSGWDRVSKDLPSSFDASIIVDASTMTLFEKLQDPHTKGIVASKPCVVLDHHAITDHPIDFATVVLNEPSRASTGELLYHLARDYGWHIEVAAGEYIMSSILGDTQGLTNELTGSDTYRVMAELTDMGVSRPRLEELRREYGKMPEVIFRYKATLINRTEVYADGRVAVVSVSQQEINDYSPLYNPAPLVQADMLQIKGVQVTVVLKRYDSGRITGAIRANSGYTIAGSLAEHFGGGGHHYASGFKITDGRPFDEIKSECITYAQTLLDNLMVNTLHETV